MGLDPAMYGTHAETTESTTNPSQDEEATGALVAARPYDTGEYSSIFELDDDSEMAEQTEV